MRFRRHPGRAPTDLSTLLTQGEDMIGQLAEAHLPWGFGSADDWQLDQGTGLITWSFPDRTATAPAQIIGTHHPDTGTWLWAWANNSIAPGMTRDSRMVRDWAEASGHRELTLPRIEADRQRTAAMAAIAVRVTGATGYYRGTGGDVVPVITFGPVTVTTVDGRRSTYEIEVSGATHPPASGR
jgi:hypothetical protein